MTLKPLSEPGVPFTVAVTVDHAVTGLFVLPEGSFYTVESLVLDPVTGTPLRPLIDYMYFQQNVDVSAVTGKQAASIIQIRNTDITSVVVKGRYTHGIDQSEIDNWNNICVLYKDVPKWMNWLACLDDPLQVHPNVKRVVKDLPLEKRTLDDVAVTLNYLADQFESGDSLYLEHILYWQQELFNIGKATYDQYMTDLTTFVTNLSSDTGGKVGDFKFTDGDGAKWSGGKKNEYFGTTLRDRGLEAIGTYKYLPEGSSIPSRLTKLYQIVTNVQTIQGTITTDKTSYYQTDTMTINVNITRLTNRVLANANLQLVDPTSEVVVATFPLTNMRVGTFPFTFDLKDMDVGLFNKKLIVRVPEYMWLNPVIVTVAPSGDPSVGYINAELLGYDNVGSISKAGYTSTIKVKFKRVGTLKSAQTLYVHLAGDYPADAIKPGYPILQRFDFPITFNESTETVAEFAVAGTGVGQYRVEVKVSTASDPLNNLAIKTSNLWYITTFPFNPYIEWYFATLNGTIYERVNTVSEGTDVFVVGKLSLDKDLMGDIPQLQVTSKGVGAAIEGVDFNIQRNPLITIDRDTVAWKITLPLKPEQETTFKFLNVKTINSNTAELWIVDKTADAPIAASWHATEINNAPVVDWVSETSTFYLRIKTQNIPDGTRLNLSLASPELYRPSLTIPSQVTVFGNVAVAEIKLNAPATPNATQYLKILVTGPAINYTTLGLMVLDTSKPTYQIRYVVNQLTDALTAYPGDMIRCQVRCIKATSANGTAAIHMSGDAMDSDYNLPTGTISPLKSSTVNATEWTDIFVDGLTLKTPMRLDHLTATTNIVFPIDANGIKQGLDSNLTLNLRSS